MDAREYLGIDSTEDPTRWSVPVRLPICGGSGYLHGGCALGIAVQVAEDGLDRPLAWASAQFISRVGPGDIIDVAVEPLATGNRMSQAQIRATHQGKVIFVALAALGGRELGIDGSFVSPPDVPDPESCPTRPARPWVEGTFNPLLDVRIARREPQSRRSVFWLRASADLGASAAGLGMIGDLLPTAMRLTADTEMRGSSLENTIRVVAPESSEWLLLDCFTDAFANSIGQGTMHIYSQSGTLLGTASQSYGIHSIEQMS